MRDNYGQGPGLGSWLRHSDFEVKVPAASQGVLTADGLAAPLNEAAGVAQCFRQVVAAARRDHDLSSRRAGGAAIDHVDHDAMQLGDA